MGDRSDVEPPPFAGVIDCATGPVAGAEPHGAGPGTGAPWPGGTDAGRGAVGTTGFGDGYGAGAGAMEGNPEGALPGNGGSPAGRPGIGAFTTANDSGEP